MSRNTRPSDQRTLPLDDDEGIWRLVGAMADPKVGASVRSLWHAAAKGQLRAFDETAPKNDQQYFRRRAHQERTAAAIAASAAARLAHRQLAARYAHLTEPAAREPRRRPGLHAQSLVAFKEPHNMERNEHETRI